MRRVSPAAAVLVGGLIAGAFDITYACVFSYLRSGVSPVRILQSVASGLLGAAARDGGAATAALGLFLHFLIAITWAALFYEASRHLPVLRRRPVLSGVVYGAVIYAVMNLIVVPLSAFPRKLTFPPLVLWTGLFVHMFLIGLPIALSVRRAFEPEPAASAVAA
jgi:hypothetical protein